jgi:hypothetical protein
MGAQHGRKISMKRLLGVIVSLLVLVCGFVEAQAPESPSSQAQVQELKENWGPITEGVRVGLSVDKLTYSVGQDVTLHIVVENVSATQPVYGEPFRPRARDHNLAIGVMVQSKDGPLSPGPWDVSSLPMGGGPLQCPAPYLPGKPKQIDKTLRQFRLLPTKPGTYKIIVTWSLYTADVQSCDAVIHLIPGAPPAKPAAEPPEPPPAKPFVSVTSNSVFLQVVGN